MRTIMPASASRKHIGLDTPALDSTVEVAFFELSLDLGIDLFAYVDTLVGESGVERAARLDAATDMLVDDPELYALTFRLVTHSIGAASPKAGAAIHLLPAMVRPSAPSWRAAA